jgi:hypothetical protein
MPETIAVRERTTKEISADQYHTLEGSLEISDILGAGIISLVRSKEIPYGLRASAYVGQTTVGAVRLVIEEKASGALQALLRFALPDTLREVATTSFIGRESPFLSLFVERYLEMMGAYLRRGRYKRYRTQALYTANPRGKVDVRGTLRQRSRGRVGGVVCRPQSLSPDLLPNQLLALGLYAAEIYCRSIPDHSELLAQSRTYLPLFEDVEWLRHATLNWENKAAYFNSVDGDRFIDDELKRALQYSRALVLHLGIWPKEDVAGRIPHSFFLNLETLFEDSVRRLAAESFSDVRKGAVLKVPMFANLPDRYVADPDLVFGPLNAPLLVADCKYKDFSGYPDHSDLYQLLSHATTLKCNTALLLYPGADCTITELGTAFGNIRVHLATARPQHLDQDVVSLFGDLLNEPTA